MEPAGGTILPPQLGGSEGENQGRAWSGLERTCYALRESRGRGPRRPHPKFLLLGVPLPFLWKLAQWCWEWFWGLKSPSTVGVGYTVSDCPAVWTWWGPREQREATYVMGSETWAGEGGAKEGLVPQLRSTGAPLPSQLHGSSPCKVALGSLLPAKAEVWAQGDTKVPPERPACQGWLNPKAGPKPWTRRHLTCWHPVTCWLLLEVR